MTRRILSSAALIAALFIAGGLCGVGVHRWAGGLGPQHAQLEQCILASRHSHGNEAPGSALTHLQAEVPNCMDAAGYEKALANENCGAAMWQGDLFCYVPKSFLGKLVYRFEASSQRMRSGDEGKTRSPREG